MKNNQYNTFPKAHFEEPLSGSSRQDQFPADTLPYGFAKDSKEELTDSEWLRETLLRDGVVYAKKAKRRGVANVSSLITYLKNRKGWDIKASVTKEGTMKYVLKNK